MKRILIDYKKLTPEILNLLVEKFPDGYGDRDIITFDDHKNQTINAVEVKTEEAIYLIKVESKLHYSIMNHDSITFKDDGLSEIISLDNLNTSQIGEPE